MRYHNFHGRESGSSRHKAPCLTVTNSYLSKPFYRESNVEFSHTMMLTSYLPRIKTGKLILFSVTRIDREIVQVK